MKNVSLLIGPSGVGKSSVIKEIAIYKTVEIYKLDDLVKEFSEETSISKYFSRIGNKAFFEKSIQTIEGLEKEFSGKQVLIDVGAGSIDWEGCTEIFIKHQLISLTGDKEILYDRVKTRALKNGSKESRTLEQYTESEFMPHKKAL
jgi:shikimate kinase